MSVKADWFLLDLKRDMSVVVGCLEGEVLRWERDAWSGVTLSALSGCCCLLLRMRIVMSVNREVFILTVKSRPRSY